MKHPLSQLPFLTYLSLHRFYSLDLPLLHLLSPNPEMFGEAPPVSQPTCLPFSPPFFSFPKLLPSLTPKSRNVWGCTPFPKPFFGLFFSLHISACPISPRCGCILPDTDSAATGSVSPNRGGGSEGALGKQKVCRSGLVVARLLAAREDPGSNHAADISLCFHENHCDTVDS